jgi:hypothetical protein
MIYCKSGYLLIYDEKIFAGAVIMPEVDITSRIKLIESLKCALLNDISALYESMRIPLHQDNRDENLVSLIVHTYLLASGLGLKFEELDGQVIKKLKLEARENKDMQLLLKHFTRRCGHESDTAGGR